MASRRPTRGARSTVAFEALSIEGGLLSPEWLARLAQRDAGQQAEADYRVPRGLQLRDEIGRYWRIAQAWWSDFDAGRARGGDPLALSTRFVSVLLTDVLGFTSLKPASAPAEREGRRFPVTLFDRDGRVPVVIAPAGDGLDAPSARLGDGGRRRSAFGLAQEFLNAADEALWGLASDGLTLRLLRDNASLTRPAWIEADLGRIFAEERYADFAALWLLLHETRFGNGDAPPTDCPLEHWRTAGREEGTRAREHLRNGVEQALLAFGQGFVAHPDNTALRAALADRTLSPTALYQELLRLAYRLIFLLTVEERGVLHPPDASAAAMALYDGGYSVRRLRERALRRSAHDRFADLWEALKLVFRAVGRGEPLLALPALGGIFAASQCPTLDGAKLANSFLLTGVFRLAWIVGDNGIARVNWRDMGAEELGSVYESLLELVPRVDLEARRFTFAAGDEAKGNARKTSGSYYTPDSLVQVLLDSALEPVVKDAIAAHPADPVAALLDLSVVDPACGSGHFLLAAARRLAGHVARLSANGTPSAAEYRHALRLVVGRCIYGVDLNPMAIELCKVSLWMEAVEPGLTLSFLDAHLQCGNALIGATPELMDKGVPDAAWEPLEGDDKRITGALKRRNKQGTKGLQMVFDTLWAKGAANDVAAVVEAVDALERSPDAQLPEVQQMASRWDEIRASEAYQHQRHVADLWCSAFVWPKLPGELANDAPTHSLWQQVREKRGAVTALAEKTTKELAEEYQFFHWHLAFPKVHARGGFDVVLGNPPWERVKLQEQEFFASRDAAIAGATNAAARKKLIADLPRNNRPLWDAWCNASRAAEGQSHFVRQSGRFPLCGKGDVNTYALFAEHNRALLGTRGRAGFIVPTGIATDSNTKEYFGSLIARKELSRLYGFENEEFVFPAVHHAFKFALLSLDRSGQTEKADLVFFARQVSALSDAERHFSLTPGDFAALNPNTRTCPTFRSRRDAELNLALYQRAGVLWREDNPEGNAWGLQFMRMFDMANDSGDFRTRAELETNGWKLEGNHFRQRELEMLPLVEAKMVHIFEHRLGTYEGISEAQSNQGVLPHLTPHQRANPWLFAMPEYWVDARQVQQRVASSGWTRRWFICFRDVARSVEFRTAIHALIPFAAVGHKAPIILPLDVEPAKACSLYAALNSFVYDYAARQKVGGASLALFIVKQLPVPPPAFFDGYCPWDRGTRIVEWILPRVLELTYTAWDLADFAADVGHHGPPFRWDAARRELLRAELDAGFFHLYGLSRADAAYVMETFTVAKKYDEKAHNEYRTRDQILRAYDALAEMQAAQSEEKQRDELRASRRPTLVRVTAVDTQVAELMDTVGAKLACLREKNAWDASQMAGTYGISIDILRELESTSYVLNDSTRADLARILSRKFRVSLSSLLDMFTDALSEPAPADLAARETDKS